MVDTKLTIKFFEEIEKPHSYVFFFLIQASIDNFSTRNDVYLTCENYTAKGENEISLTKGQNVEVLSKPPGSRSWRVRVLDEIIGGDREGFVPHQVLRRLEDSPMRGKRNSVETLNSQSSEGALNINMPERPQCDVVLVSGKLENKKSLFFLQHDCSDPEKKRKFLPLSNYLLKVNHKHTRVISVDVDLLSLLLTLRVFAIRNKRLALLLKLHPSV